MTSLADELLADLEVSQDDEINTNNNHDNNNNNINENNTANTNNNYRSIHHLPTTTNIITMTKSLDDIAILWKSDQVKSLLQQITHFKENPTTTLNLTLTEDHPEYQLIVSANTLVVDIENELLAVHKHLRDLYARRFPELESLIQNPLDYARTIQILKNDTKVANYDSLLREFLPSATLMVINVTSTTNFGSSLSPHELAQALQCCDCMFELHSWRSIITDYVESRLFIIAPNLSAIIGSKTAAQMLGAAGGLNALSRIPSCNIPMLGSTKKNLHGFSSANPDLRNGYLYSSPLISRATFDIKKRLVRIVAAKISLAVRVDCAKETPDGAIGRKFKAEIDEKIDKWQEPPPSLGVRALEAPLEKPKQKRGGKRLRKMKEKYTVTELQKQQNRMAFGVAEEEVVNFDETEGLGMINQSIGTGKVRAALVDNRVKAKVKNLTAKKLNGPQQPSSGLSSLVFTPVQGMELVDPEAQTRKLKEINDKWFSYHKMPSRKQE